MTTHRLRAPIHGRARQAPRPGRPLATAAQPRAQPATPVTAGAAPRPTPNSGRRRLRSMSLTELAEEFGSDKWGVHRYTPHYEHHFAPCATTRPWSWSSGSAATPASSRAGRRSRCGSGSSPAPRSWASTSRTSRSSTSRGSGPTSRAPRPTAPACERIVREHGAPTIVIDDGSHRSAARYRVLRDPLPAARRRRSLRDRGHPDQLLAAAGAAASTPTTRPRRWRWSAACRRAQLRGVPRPGLRADVHRPHVVAVHCYHNLVLIQKGENREGTNKRACTASGTRRTGRCASRTRAISGYPDTVDRPTARRTLGLDEGDVALLTLGRIRPYKGLLRLLELTADLAVEDHRRRLWWPVLRAPTRRATSWPTAWPRHLTS